MAGKKLSGQAARRRVITRARGLPGLEPGSPLESRHLWGPRGGVGLVVGGLVGGLVGGVVGGELVCC